MNIEKPSFKGICLMHIQALTNFPYVEKDFDAITDYELLCKVVDYLNQVITNSNEQNAAITSLYDAFIEVKDYVDNYFDNLDVQDEINNKLDKMANDGSLYELIERFTSPLIETQNIKIKQIDDKVNTVASGSPAGVYPTIESLQQADPNHSRIYVVEGDGEWYFWNTATNQWKNGGVYQAEVRELDKTLTESGVAPDSQVVGDYITDITRSISSKDKEIKLVIDIQENKYYDLTNGSLEPASGFIATEVDVEKLRGKILKIDAHQRLKAGTIFATVDGTSVAYAQQTETNYYVVPQTAKYLRTCSDETLTVTLIDRIYSNEDVISNEKIIENNIIKNYLLWDRLTTASMSEFTGGATAVLNNGSTASGKLKIKVNVLKDTFINIFTLRDTTVIDNYIAPVKQGNNEIITNIDVQTGDKIGFTTYDNATIGYTTSVSNGVKYRSGLKSENFANVYKGDTLDVTEWGSTDGSFYFDYSIFTVIEKDIKDYIEEYSTVPESTSIINILKNADSQIKIKIIGDSITDGFIVQKSQAYSGLLKSYLESNYNCQVNIQGHSGKNSIWFVENISTLIDDDDDIVITMFGTNNRGTESNYNQLYADLTTYENYCKQRNMKHIVMIPPISTPTGTEGEDRYTRYCHMDKIAHQIVSWCKANNKEFIDLYEQLYEMTLLSNTSMSDLLADGLHPNANGHYLMFRLVCKGLEIYAKIKNATW